MRNIIAARRQDPEFRGKWGLYSVVDERWLDVIYASEKEAAAAVAIIMRGCRTH